MLSLSSPATTLSLPATSHPRRRHLLRHARPSVSASATATFPSFETSYKPRSSPLPARDMAAACASFYEILGISVGATSEEIKAAYRRLARVCHPDVAAVGGTAAAADEFMKIHMAYSTLSDPQKRAVYDGKLYRKRRPLTAASPGVSGYRGRNWETDQCW